MTLLGRSHFAERNKVEAPFFSICIPQHNRTSFLKEAIKSFAEQSFREIEVCISDGNSTDGRELELIEFLESLNLSYRYSRSEKNLPYDPNTRSAIQLARGRYCILMGNDDALNGADALARLHQDIVSENFPSVIISDFNDYRTGTRAFRIRQYLNCGSGPKVATMHFRNFSFVSGITLETAPAHRFATDAWDGSEMYQTYIGCKMIASGLSLLERDHQLVRKDIVIDGETVDSYSTKPKIKPCPIITRRIPLGQLGLLVSAAIRDFTTKSELRRCNLRILLQLIGLTFPGWLFQYRKVQSWNYAAGLALGMRPSLTAPKPMGIAGRLIAWLVYLGVTIVGLIMPQWLFSSMRLTLYRIAKSIR